MTGQEILIALVRSKIDDAVTPYVYSDDSLNQLNCLSAFELQARTSFQQTYTFDFTTWTISPDPASDTDFMSLIVLKSALTLMAQQANTQIGKAAVIKMAADMVDLRSASTDKLKLIRDVFKKEFDEALMNYRINRSVLGRVVSGPIRLYPGGYYLGSLANWRAF